MAKIGKPEEIDFLPEDDENHESQLGKNEKPLNMEALNELMNSNKKNRKKGKRGGDRSSASNKHTSEEQSAADDTSTSTNNSSTGAAKKRKKQVVVLSDPTNAQELSEIFRPVFHKEKREAEKEKPQITQKDYQNSVILATVGGQVEEADVLRILAGIPPQAIHCEPGYFIIELMNQEDLKKVLKKNKTSYKTCITVLVGEYSIEDENPKLSQHYQQSNDSYGYRRSDNSSYFSERNDNSSKITMGMRTQDSSASNGPRSGYDRSGNDRYGNERSGYDRSGNDRYGNDRSGYDRSGNDRYGSERSGYDRSGYERSGNDRYGSERSGYDRSGYERSGNERSERYYDSSTSQKPQFVFGRQSQSQQPQVQPQVQPQAYQSSKLYVPPTKSAEPPKITPGRNQFSSLND